MAKRAGFLALGGHIASQNASFRTIMNSFGDGWEFYGLENGFNAFESGIMYPLSPELLDPNYAGFYAGATRANLTDKQGRPIQKRIDAAIRFIRLANLDYLVGSGGDDHGLQLNILREALEAESVPCKVLVLSKSMDGDKGGKDEEILDGYVGPFADTTNGFHTAVQVGVDMIHQHLSGAWTNGVATIVSHFGRDANWVNAALAWNANADLALYGELPKEHPGHSIERIAELTHQAMERNRRQYGRPFATIVASEGTGIMGVEHVSEQVDAHGHKKLKPELLASGLYDRLGEHGIKAQTLVISYAMRNHPATEMDLYLARLTGVQIAEAMKDGATGLEAALKFRDGAVVSELTPIELASQKRLVAYYPKPLYNPDTFEPLPEIGRYFRPLFGNRVPLETLLPRRPTVVNVYGR